MNTWVTASLILGVAGSLHCLGMCGPLVMAIHHGKGRSTRLQRIVYHAGRISIYGLLGLIMGALGATISMFGYQQKLALAAGVLMLLFLLLPNWMSRFKLTSSKQVQWIRQKAINFKNNSPHVSMYLFGLLNGLLPCGLVYVALAGSLAAGSLGGSALFMVFFGLGTTPVLLASSELLQWIGKHLRVNSFKAVQVALVAFAILITLRGANLGIPFLSPEWHAEKAVPSCCSHGQECN